MEPFRAPETSVVPIGDEVPRRSVMGLTWRFVWECGLVLSLFLGYRYARRVTRNDSAEAMENARRVISIERARGIFLEPLLQDVTMLSEHLVFGLNRYYVSVHFPLTGVFVAWVLVRHFDRFSSVRNWLIVVTGSALAIHILFPLAPPRLVRDADMVDTLRRYGPSIYPVDTTESLANQFAAMPSLHFGWALIVALGFVAIRGTRRSWLAMLHPTITLLAIVATGNHYFADAAVAAVLVIGAGATFGMLEIRRSGAMVHPCHVPR